MLLNIYGVLFVPEVEGRGLYQDGYIKSTSLLSPTTLYSILFLTFITIFAFLIKNRFPLIAVAILFYLAAHLMESTFIGLELYFEHRNYLGAFIFIFTYRLWNYFIRGYC